MVAAALKEALAAHQQFPLSRGIAHQYAEAMIASGQLEEAARFLREQAQFYKEEPEVAYLTEDGAVLLQRGAVVAQLDDRDVAQAMELLQMDGHAVGDETLLAWLEDSAATAALTLCSGGLSQTSMKIPNISSAACVNRQH
eukprot:gene26842-30342_t